MNMALGCDQDHQSWFTIRFFNLLINALVSPDCCWLMMLSKKFINYFSIFLSCHKMLQLCDMLFPL